MTRHGKDSRRSRERELSLGQERCTLNIDAVFQCEVDAHRNTGILDGVLDGCVEPTAWQTISRHPNGDQHFRESQIMGAISRSSLAKNQYGSSGWSTTGCYLLAMGGDKHPTWIGILVQHFLNLGIQGGIFAAIPPWANKYRSINHIFLLLITCDNTHSQLSNFH